MHVIHTRQDLQAAAIRKAKKKITGYMNEGVQQSAGTFLENHVFNIIYNIIFKTLSVCTNKNIMEISGH